jgi:hypothetical protein
MHLPFAAHYDMIAVYQRALLSPYVMCCSNIIDYVMLSYLMFCCDVQVNEYRTFNDFFARRLKRYNYYHHILSLVDMP